MVYQFIIQTSVLRMICCNDGLMCDRSSCNFRGGAFPGPLVSSQNRCFAGTIRSFRWARSPCLPHNLTTSGHVLTQHGFIGLCVCLLVTLVSPANTAKPIEILFGADWYGNHLFVRGSMDTMWQIQLNDMWLVVIWAVATITVATCLTWLLSIW